MDSEFQWLGISRLKGFWSDQLATYSTFLAVWFEKVFSSELRTWVGLVWGGLFNNSSSPNLWMLQFRIQIQLTCFVDLCLQSYPFYSIGKAIVIRGVSWYKFIGEQIISQREVKDDFLAWRVFWEICFCFIHIFPQV